MLHQAVPLGQLVVLCPEPQELLPTLPRHPVAEAPDEVPSHVAGHVEHLVPVVEDIQTVVDAGRLALGKLAGRACHKVVVRCPVLPLPENKEVEGIAKIFRDDHPVRAGVVGHLAMDPVQPLHGLRLTAWAAAEDLLKKEHRRLLPSLKKRSLVAGRPASAAQYLFCYRLVPSMADFMRSMGRGFTEEETVLSNSFLERLRANARSLVKSSLGEHGKRGPPGS